MREVCFRGKRTYDGRWCYGVPVNCDGGDVILVGDLDKYQTVYELYQATEDVIPETVGQYTGRNVGADKLFEGDIIEWQEDYDDLWGDSKSYTGHSIVIWDSDNSCWSLKTDTYIQPFNDFTWDRCYVVGNIHDNPELLKGEGQ
jgi:uncharacterized phage protein (TIGR01671 family)